MVLLPPWDLFSLVFLFLFALFFPRGIHLLYVVPSGMERLDMFDLRSSRRAFHSAPPSALSADYISYLSTVLDLD
jgi:hypothetical protein